VDSLWGSHDKAEITIEEREQGSLEERPAKRDSRLEVQNFLPRTKWSLSIAILERSDRGISVFGRRSVSLEERPVALRLEASFLKAQRADLLYLRKNSVERRLFVSKYIKSLQVVVKLYRSFYTEFGEQIDRLTD